MPWLAIQVELDCLFLGESPFGLRGWFLAFLNGDSGIVGSSTFLSALRHRDDSRLYDNCTLNIFLSAGLGTPLAFFVGGAVRKSGAVFLQSSAVVFAQDAMVSSCFNSCANRSRSRLAEESGCSRMRSRPMPSVETK